MALQNSPPIQQDTPKQKLLSDWKFISKLVYENEDCTLHYAHVYSYMLCKYEWFKSMNKDFFESQQELSRACSMSVSAIKLALKYLEQKELVIVSKRKTLAFNKNVYKVVDIYGAYTKLPYKVKNKPKVRRSFVDDIDEQSAPF